MKVIVRQDSTRIFNEFRKVQELYDDEKQSLQRRQEQDIQSLRERFEKELEVKEEQNESQRIQFEKELEAQKQLIETLKEQLDRSYTLNVVHCEYEEKRDEIEVKEEEVVHGDGELYRRHRDIVEEWNVLTGKLEKLAREATLKGGDDDEKQPEKRQQERPGLSADELYREYVHSYNLIQRQNVRLEQVEDEQHLKELILQQDGLRV